MSILLILPFNKTPNDYICELYSKKIIDINSNNNFNIEVYSLESICESKYPNDLIIENTKYWKDDKFYSSRNNSIDAINKNKFISYTINSDDIPNEFDLIWNETKSGIIKIKKQNICNNKIYDDKNIDDIKEIKTINDIYMNILLQLNWKQDKILIKNINETSLNWLNDTETDFNLTNNDELYNLKNEIYYNDSDDEYNILNILKYKYFNTSNIDDACNLYIIIELLNKFDIHNEDWKNKIDIQVLIIIIKLLEKIYETEIKNINNKQTHNILYNLYKTYFNKSV